MISPVYLDYNASTPIHPRVADAMRPWLAAGFGNPSSGHWASAAARSALAQARARIAALLECHTDEVIFTSGGSEANNLAIKGALFARGTSGGHIITSAIEHPSVLRPCQFLERFGAVTTLLPVDGAGRVDPEDVRRAITPRTSLISVMHANNEVGTIQPIREISTIAREHGILFHTDAAQSAGKVPTRVDALGVDLLTLAGHKFYAPKGIGALYIRRGVVLEPLIHGGGHEQGRRAGTESALLSAGLGEASTMACDLAPMAEVGTLRDYFWDTLQRRPGRSVVLNGHPRHRLPNTLNVSFPGYNGGELLQQLEGVAASTGSACHAGRVQLSPVLQAMGVPPGTGLGAIRFSLGRETTRAEIDVVLERLLALTAGSGESAT